MSCLEARYDEGSAASSRGRLWCGTKAAVRVLPKEEASALEETALVGEHERLRPVAQVQLLQQPGHVRLDRGVADEQLAPDLRVGVALGDQPEDVQLAGRQRLDRLGRLVVRPRELRDD